MLLGKKVGATPDGRKSGDWIASNCGPSIGTDRDSLSALIKSFTKLDFTKLPAGSPINLKIGEKFVQGEQGIGNLVALLRSFVELNGNMMTVIVQDTETLRKAQKEPEKYRGLKVTVSGYQVYFTLLDPEHQEFHIQKTQHGFD